MDNWETIVKKMIGLMGFADYRVEVNEADRRGTVFIYDAPYLVQSNLPQLIESVNHLMSLVAKKQDQAPIFFDFNNYRKERENLIAELARTAARKVLATGQVINLPAMNSYERRIVHTELATNPGVVTESTGAGKDRYVTIKPLSEQKKQSQQINTD